MDIKPWDSKNVKPASGPFVIPGLLEATLAEWHAERDAKAFRDSITTKTDANGIVTAAYRIHRT